MPKKTKISTVRKRKADLGTQYDGTYVNSTDRPFDETNRSRFKGQTFIPKETSPGVFRIAIGQAKPTRPQLKERMSVGGRKAKTKGRTDPKAAKARDPGPTPMPSTTVHHIVPDKDTQMGFKRGAGWPASKPGAGGSSQVTAAHP